MKKITLLIALLFTCILTAPAQQTTATAAKSGAIDAKTMALLCHKWRPTHFEAMGQRQPMEQGANGSYMWFKEDGTIQDIDESGTSTGKWSYDPATKILTVTEHGEAVDQTIKTLTEKELIIVTSDKTMGEIGIVLSRID